MTRPEETSKPPQPPRPPTPSPPLPGRVLRGVARRLRLLGERLTHGRRRARLVRSFRPRSATPTILVLCLGNICRSPYAAARLEARLGERARIRSGGFLRSGRSSPPEAVDAADGRGVDLRPHRSSQIGADDVRNADLIVVMEPGQRDRVERLVPGAGARTIVLGELDPAPWQTRAIPDPWGRPPAEFERCYDRVDRCAGALAGLLLARR